MAVKPIVLNVELFSRFAAITPSDTKQYGVFAASPIEDINAIYVGATGDLAVVGSDGVAATFKSVPTGTVLNISPLIVKTTGTTATQLVALYW